MQLLASGNLAKIISSIPTIIILLVITFSIPIAAYSQFSFIVPNHQRQPLPISQVASFSKDKSKTSGVGGTEHKGPSGSSEGPHQLSSVSPSALLTSASGHQQHW